MTSEPGAEGRKTARAFALIATLTAVFFADVLFFGKRLFIRDVASYYYPTKKLLRECWMAGDLPLWNHAYSAGQPMAANPEYAVFYPPHLLLLLPDYGLAFQLLVVFHVVVGSWGAYRFLRSMGLRESSSLFGAITFAFGGLTASLLNLLPYLFLLTWLPWAFLHVRRWLTAGAWRDMALAALFLGLQLLTAEPTTLVQVWLLVGLYGLHRVASAERKRDAVGRIAPRVAVLLIAALAVGAVQLLPAIDHSRDSVRTEPFSYETVRSWSMPAIRAVEVAIPGAFGRVWREDETAYLGAVLYSPRPLPFLFSVYAGMLGCCLAAAGVRARLPGTGLLIAVLLIAFVLALGDHTPLLRWLYDAGIAQSFRYAEKFAIMGLLALMVYQARAFDALLDDPRRLGRSAAVAASFCLVVSLTGFVLFSGGERAGIVRSLTGIANGHAVARIVRDAQFDWMANSLRAAVVLALCVAAARGRVGKKWVAVALATAFVDLATAGRAVAPSIDAHYFDEPPVAAKLDGDRDDYRIFPLADWYDTFGRSENGRKFSTTGAGTYWALRDGLAPTLSAAWGFRYAAEIDYDRTNLLPAKRFVETVWRVRNAVGVARDATLMAMAGVRYSTRFRDFRTARAQGTSLASLEPVEFVRTGTGVRYYFAESVIRVSDASDMQRSLIASDPGPRVAFVDRSVPAAAAPGHVISWRESARTITIDAEASGRSLLVLSVTPHKYWHASVDGKPVRVVSVNAGFSGVSLEPGRHRVRLEYRNPVLIAGAELSLVAILCLGALAVPARGRRDSVR